MLSNLHNTRQNLTGTIILLYSLPIVFVSFFATNRSWGGISFGLFLTIMGSFAFFILLRNWEAMMNKKAEKRAEEKVKSLQINQVEQKERPQGPQVSKTEEHNAEETKIIQDTISESQKKQNQLLNELNKKNEELRKLEQEKEKIQQQADDIFQEFAQYKDVSQEEIDQKKVMLSEYQQTISEQRSVIKKKQVQIAELESKVEDLNYEVKTLVHLSDFTTSSPSKPSEPPPVEQTEPEIEQKPPVTPDRLVRSSEEASILLKRCIDIAQKITGANLFINSSSRFRDLHINSYSLDLRRLFDSLRSENSGVVLFYSPKESKLLFVNNQVKNLLGWSPEKIVQDFHEIIQNGQTEWKNGIASLSNIQESNVHMSMKTKAGQNLSIQCHLRTIPTGIFRHNVIGVVYRS